MERIRTKKNFDVTRAASRGVADYLWTDYHVPVDREGC